MRPARLELHASWLDWTRTRFTELLSPDVGKEGEEGGKPLFRLSYRWHQTRTRGIAFSPFLSGSSSCIYTLPRGALRVVL